MVQDLRAVNDAIQTSGPNVPDPHTLLNSLSQITNILQLFISVIPFYLFLYTQTHHTGLFSPIKA